MFQPSNAINILSSDGPKFQFESIFPEHRSLGRIDVLKYLERIEIRQWDYLDLASPINGDLLLRSRVTFLFNKNKNAKIVSEGSACIHQTQSYKSDYGIITPQNTMQDGSCAFSALDGTLNSKSVYACDARKKRELFCHWIREHIENNNIPTKIKCIFSDWFYNYDNLSKEIRDQINEVYRSHKNSYDSKTDTKERIEELERFTLHPKVHEAYLSQVSDRNYWLSQDELILAAQCFKKNLFLHQPGWGNDKENCRSYELEFDSSWPIVHIWYNGQNHYQRAAVEKAKQSKIDNVLKISEIVQLKMTQQSPTGRMTPSQRIYLDTLNKLHAEKLLTFERNKSSLQSKLGKVKAGSSQLNHIEKEIQEELEDIDVNTSFLRKMMDFKYEDPTFECTLFFVRCFKDFSLQDEGDKNILQMWTMVKDMTYDSECSGIFFLYNRFFVNGLDSTRRKNLLDELSQYLKPKNINIYINCFDAQKSFHPFKGLNVQKEEIDLFLAFIDTLDYYKEELNLFPQLLSDSWNNVKQLSIPQDIKGSRFALKGFISDRLSELAKTLIRATCSLDIILSETYKHKFPQDDDQFNQLIQIFKHLNSHGELTFFDIEKFFVPLWERILFYPLITDITSNIEMKARKDYLTTIAQLPMDALNDEIILGLAFS